MTDKTLDVWLNRTPRPTPPVWPSSAATYSAYMLAEAKWHFLRSGELVWMAGTHLVMNGVVGLLQWVRRVYPDSAIGRKAEAALTYLHARG